MPDPIPQVSLLASLGPTPEGVNSGLAPTLLPPTQLAWGVNITTRGGFPHNRPPIRKLSISYADDQTANLSTRAIFQGAAYYSSFGNNPSCIVASIGGRIFRYLITNDRVQVQDITPPGEANNPTLEQAWLGQGQDFMLINDGESRPFSFDGAGVRRLPSGDWLPASRDVHYVQGRFVVVLPDARSYIASDLVYSTVSGSPSYDYRDSILRTTELRENLGNFPFAVPINAGPITSLFSVAIPDTSLGQGPLQIGTTGGVFSTNLPFDSTLWTTTDPPTQVVSLPNGGPTGFYAVTTVNGDAWYRAGDGLRSFVVARRDFNTWVQTPLSNELSRVLPYDTSALLNRASAVHFNNRLLCTCSPYRVNGRGIAHRGLVALDFHNISTINSRSNPSYDGLWTGIPILQLVKGRFNGVERCFAFALACDGAITLYEIGYDGSARSDYDGANEVATECWMESCAILGRDGDRRFIKRLQSAQLWLDQLSGPDEGNILFTPSYRSDYDPCYRPWSSGFTLCAPACKQPANCTQPITTHPQYATYIDVPQPDDTINPITRRPYRTGYLFQFKLAWTGHVSVQTLNIWGTPQTENLGAQGYSTSTPACQILQCCVDDMFGYSIEDACSTVCDVTITQEPTVTYSNQLEWDVDNDAPTWDVDSGSTITPIPDPGPP